MADKLKHVTPRSPKVWDTINALVDRVNEQDELIKNLSEEKAKPATRRTAKSTSSDKE